VTAGADSVAVTRARGATYVAFVAAGFAFTSWASRIPQIRDRLDLDPAALGLLLLAVAAGSVLALPTAGAVVARLDAARVVASCSLLVATGLVVMAVGVGVGVAPVAVGLFLVGVGNGAWDVAMNVQGARVEQLMARSLMPRFHAGFSLGTVGGALAGAAMVALDVGVTPHLVVAAVAVALVVPVSVRAFVPAVDDAGAERAHRQWVAWLEPRTLLIGVVVLAFAFAEGTANDWTAVAVIDDYGAHAVAGALAFATFLTAMTAARWFGTPLVDRYGRVPVVRLLCAVAVAGLVLFVFAPWTALGFVGVLLWGAGTSLGFPLGMSAAADEPDRAAGRVSVVASIGYCAFLAGPPLIGFLGQQASVLKALLVVAGLLSIAAVLAANLAEPSRADG
jgi:predicted MFS family arabinose efflux permease